MVMAALDLHARGLLRNDAIAVTVMSNLGLRRALRAAGIGLVETPVGDRHVVAAMQEHDLVLGGEQSGHVIFPDLATTGDGLLTGVQVLAAVHAAGQTLAEAAEVMTSLPQVLRNVRVAERRPDIADRLAADIAAAETRLGPRGRVLIRPSGTEPLVRVMIEAEDLAVAEAEAAVLADAAARASA
jgi:phosphoglucosamine mutase